MDDSFKTVEITLSEFGYFETVLLRGRELENNLVSLAL